MCFCNLKSLILVVSISLTACTSEKDIPKQAAELKESGDSEQKAQKENLNKEISAWFDSLDYTAKGQVFQQVPFPNDSVAILYIYRPARFSDLPYSPDIYINGKMMVELEGDGYTWILLQKGSYKIESTDIFTVSIQLQVEESRKYYMNYNYDWFYSKFIPTPPKDAIKEISKCKYKESLQVLVKPEDEEYEPITPAWYEKLFKFIVKVMWWVIHFVVFCIALFVTLFRFPLDMELTKDNFLTKLNESMSIVQTYDALLILGLIIAYKVYKALQKSDLSLVESKLTEISNSLSTNLDHIDDSLKTLDKSDLGVETSEKLGEINLTLRELLEEIKKGDENKPSS